MTGLLPAAARKPRRRMTKAQRPVLIPDNPVQPNIADAFTTMAYLYQQAEMGEFRDAPASALPVILYLACFAWRAYPNAENVAAGTVMSGKSAIGKIADATCLSYNGVRKGLAWLEEAGWIDAERRGYGNGSRAPHQITVRLDTSGHTDRTKQRRLVAEAEEFLARDAD